MNKLAIFTVVSHIPTTTVILITWVVGIPLFMIKKMEYQQQSNCQYLALYDCCWFSVFEIINNRIPTTHLINNTVVVVVGICFTPMILSIILSKLNNLFLL